MFTKKPILPLLTVLIFFLLLSGTAAARPSSAPINTSFTYQGRLTFDDAPADGSYDFEFRLFTDSSGDTQLGSVVKKDGVSVTDGLFMVQLDIGAVFDGGMHYLEIRVRPSGSADLYTVLDPRQALTAAPYANYAASAPWSGLTGIPAGFADGMDNDTTYTAGDGLALDGTQFMGKGTSYQNVVIVAKSGGDFSSIQDALNSILDASADNPYLVYIAPGVYSEQVTMKEYVDIEGAGELMTKITHTNNDSSHFYATLLGASNAELRFLTVENTSSTTWARAIFNQNASPRLTHVTASASKGGTYKTGIFNENASPIMTNVTISVSGGITIFGVNNYSSYPTMTNVTLSASGTSTNYGVLNRNSSTTMTNVVISASGGINNLGIYNDSDTGTHTVLVNNSKVTASNSIIHNKKGQVRIISSQLSGGTVSNELGGTVTCIGAYDENYASPGYTICP